MRFAYFIFGTGLLILCMLLIHRFLYRKLTPGKLYALWLIPALRLLFPFGWLEMPQTDITGKVLGTPYRLMAELFSEENEEKSDSKLLPGSLFLLRSVPNIGNKLVIDGVNGTDGAHMAESEMGMNNASVSGKENDVSDTSAAGSEAGRDSVSVMGNEVSLSGSRANLLELEKCIMLVIWGAGSVGCACYVCVINGKLLKDMKRMERLQGQNTDIPVYCGQSVLGSCLFGLFHPCILVSRDVVENTELYPYLLLHEETHVRQKDPIWTALRIVLCVIYWWNPLVWAAAVCAQEDGELACDERALRGLSVPEKQAYGYALLSVCRTNDRSGLLYGAACAGGRHGGMKKRIAAIVEENSPKRGLWLSVCAMLILVLLFGVCMPKSVNAADMDSAEQTERNGIAGSEEEADREGEIARVEGIAEKLNHKEGTSGTKGDEDDANHIGGTIDADREGLMYLSPLPHRDGYREAQITFISVEGLSEEPDGEESRKALDELAQSALRELYDLTGYQVLECVYTATRLGTFYFGRTEDDLLHSRDFYWCHPFGSEDGFIRSFSIASARRVWYSDVQQLWFPENAEQMDRGELAIWFLQHSALCPEGYVAETGLVYETEPDLIKVTMSDGSFYEVHLDMDILAAEAIYGPYPAGAEH